MAAFPIPNSQKAAKLVGRGMLYSILIFHLLVIVNLVFGKIHLSDYVSALILFLGLGLIPFSLIFAFCEAIFLRWGKQWKIIHYLLSKMVFSTLIIGVIVSLILLICASFYPKPVSEVWKSILLKDGLWIFIAYTPIVFLVNYIAGLIHPRLKR